MTPLTREQLAGLRELLAKGPEAEGLRNCLNGSNYLRGSEYLRLAEIIEALPALLDIAEAVQWRPIATAPKDRAILAWNGDYITIATWNATLGDWVDHCEMSGYAAFSDYPTHWQPLPAVLPLAGEA